MGKTINDAVLIDEWDSPNGIWTIHLFDNGLIFATDGYLSDWPHYYKHNGKIAYDMYVPKYVKDKIARMVKKHMAVYPLETH